MTMPEDTLRCITCEALLREPTDDGQCDECNSGYIEWLMERDLQRAKDEEEENTATLIRLQQEGMSIAEAMQSMILSAYGFDRTPGSGASHPSQRSHFLPDTDDPEGTPF